MKIIKKAAVIILIIFTLSAAIPVSATSPGFATAEEAAEGRRILPDPQYIDGGNG